MTITLDNVSYRYPQPRGQAMYASPSAVTGVSLALGEGELMAVIGPSGCGKSTILKLIAGFLAPDSGQVRIGGQDMAKDSVMTPPRLRNLGIVFQNYALFPHMSVAENVGYPLRLRHIPSQQAAFNVRDALAMVGLGSLAERNTRSLSGGQQQRVALARALVFRPRALLLDEPLSALDAAMRGEMRDEIRRLQQHHGIATLHITHDQEEAMSMADRVAVMRDGRIIQTGTPRHVYNAPENRDVASFLGHANLLDGEALDATHVRTNLGVLSCMAHVFAPGATVCVLVRPERIRPCSDGTGPNILTGTVTRDRFLGSLRRVDFRTADGVTLLVETSSQDIHASRIELPPDAVQVIAPGGKGGRNAAPDEQPHP